MKTKILMLLCSGLLLFTACKNEKESISENAEESMEQLDDKMEDMTESINDRFENLQEKIDDKIEDLKEEMEDGEAETKAEYQEQLDALEKRKEELSTKWNGFKNTARNNINDTKNDVEQWFKEVENDFSN